MNKSEEHAKIKKYIKEHFNEQGISKTPEECYKWVEGKIQTHKDLRVAILKRISKILYEKQKKYLKEEHRFFADIDTDERTQIKLPESIVRKMCNDKKYTFSNFLKEMPDILRFRIICNYLSDVYEVLDLLKEEITVKNSTSFEWINPEKDNIRLDPKERESGHRAIHCILMEREYGILFEVQITTLLQVGWDKKEHSLLYDKTKENADVELGDKMKFYAMSELLYIADDFFDKLRKDILEKQEES
ncbi:hypothetical protein KAX02_05920 [candidate division WOR-3 bacterium]|nr:hypothetical protein [candidate division WOR-3 bacterium]